MQEEDLRSPINKSIKLKWVKLDEGSWLVCGKSNGSKFRVSGLITKSVYPDGNWQTSITGYLLKDKNFSKLKGRASRYLKRQRFL